MRYYAGIDGGQSATLSVIGDETGRILARGTSGPADEVAQSASSTRMHDALSGALSDAVARANLPPATRFERIVAGVSGYEGQVYGKFPQLPTDAFTLEHDAPIAHAGAFGGEPGAIVIAGTGSVAYAVNERGASALTGGWGYLFGDEGSAFWLARDALSEAMRDQDLGEHDELVQFALQHFRVASLRKLARSFYAGEINRSQLASFGKVVLKLAEAGNGQAARCVKGGADALVMLVMRAMERVGSQDSKVACIGGMFKSATMRDEVAQCMRQLLPRARHVSPRYDPAVGALLLAYRAGGITPQNITE
jgi:glucosamine kinase